MAELSADPRDDIRSRIFNTKQLKSKEVNFFGVKIELRQPSIAQALTKHAGDEEKIAIIYNLIDCAFVPGTNTKVFTAEDYDSLIALPFGSEFLEVTQGIGELTGSNLRLTADSSKKDQ